MVTVVVAEGAVVDDRPPGHGGVVGDGGRPAGVQAVGVRQVRAAGDPDRRRVWKGVLVLG